MAAKLAGQGGGKYSLGANADINVTPFVDILLVLLIVFMVSVPLATVAIKVDLPPADVTPITNPKKPVFVSIRENELLIVDVPTSKGRLGADLTTALSANDPTKPAQEQTVLIRADRAVKYSQFMDVVNELQYDGFYKIGLISEDLG
jgi:biopolymer transport protein ExbD